MAAFHKLPLGHTTKNQELFLAYEQINKTSTDNNNNNNNNNGLTYVCLPGLGDLRNQYRFLGPLLAKDQHGQPNIVYAADLRGHGDSSPHFDDYSVNAGAQDIIALLKKLNQEHGKQQRFVLVGNSFSAATISVVLGRELPHLDDLKDQIVGAALVGPFVKNYPADKWFRPLTHVLFGARWYGVAMWTMYWKTLFMDTEKNPADFKDRVAQLDAKMREPGRLQATARMMRASKEDSEAVLTKFGVKGSATPLKVLVVMGDQDPDFSDPVGEAKWITDKINEAGAARVTCESHIVANSKHYPHVEYPEEVASAMLRFF
ncbi:hypothetical protein Poli38472_014498 [Pythium oligandrum]|uniref:AB hydrolase-1 domain-containing protein n=1 Tax=Pythium oligandrum TaxID=41045 RepID=A0A8K1FIR8_PYTOL|nr:hypothetical protein Poli38472_014498 [Pythium oligandrum]|eukprot:TMW61037.1 hypothetical protein Poli38472_014498 [Pythium oligandrum]